MVGLTADQQVSVPTLTGEWLRLTFVHWPVRVDRLQAMLPPGLTVDEYDGAGWLSFAPFVMGSMRPLSLPLLPRLGGPLPDLSQTPETNLRTYVRGPDGRDGIWFLAMQIGNPLLSVALRGLIGAPYRFGRLSVVREDGLVSYAGSRVGGGGRYRLLVRPGQEHRPPSPLEVWLTGRWRMYTHHLGRLLCTPVEHEPWPLQAAECVHLEEDLTSEAGLSVEGPPLVHFAERVQQVRAGIPRLVG